MTLENLLVDRDARVVVLTLNRPSFLNALNSATIDDLGRAIAECRYGTNAKLMIGFDRRVWRERS